MIPIRNIWLLMLYASELSEILNKTDSSVEEGRDDLHNLIAEFLATLVEKRLQRNLSYGYQHRNAELSRVRGRINFLATERSQLLSKGKISCQFEDLTINTPRNRFVLAALDKVSALVTNDPGLTHKCKSLSSRFKRLGVSGTVPSISEMSAIQLGRNDADDKAMISVAKLVFNYKIPNQESGKQFIFSPERDEIWFRGLFERAIRGFYKHTLSKDGWKVNARKLNWLIDFKTEGIDRYLPSMKTDITLDNHTLNRRIVIDTKFTSILKPGQYREESLKENYINQIFVYLMSQHNSGDLLDKTSTGILLHPGIDKSLDEMFMTQGHAIRFLTVDLSASTKDIKNQLLKVIEPIPTTH
jgi:5-methylcytosine-specific restriction enzyme subunit McrC